MELVRTSLATRTTLGVGGEAEIAECATIDDIYTALALSRQRGVPFWMLGEGSNTLARDEGYEGLVIRPTMSSITFERVQDDADTELLIAEAGAHWDAIVDAAAARGLWGIENLAGIPGTAGAAAIQNIGAYGAEFKDVVEWVECIDANADVTMESDSRSNVLRFTREQCAFGYRESRFKNEKNLIVVRVALKLSKGKGANLAYADFAKAQSGAYGAAYTQLDTPARVAGAVRAIRALKFPALSWIDGAWQLPEGGTAGSFFKNPVVRVETFATLKEQYPELPGFASGDSAMKIPLAFILDRVLGLKGYRAPDSGARLFEKQPLVLVADSGAMADDVDALANDVAKKVFDATHITIEREVVTMK